MLSAAPSYEFGPFQLNPAEGSLVAGGEPVTLAPKPFDVLRVLVQRHGHVVLKSELMALIWPDTAVEDANLTVSVSVLRKALAQRQPGTRYIQTVPKRGYRFVQEVREIATDELDRLSDVVRAMGSPWTPARHFVGREREHASLQDASALAADGTATYVTISGEPGIGKTTFVEDFLDRIRHGDQEWFVGRGRCLEHLAGVDAFLPVLGALNGLMESQGATALMKTFAPTWHVQLERAGAGRFSKVPGGPAGVTPDRWGRELGRFLSEVSRRAPVVLFFDDLHWSDASTVSLLELLANRFARDSSRILVVAAYRPSVLLAEMHPFLALKAELESRGISRELTLELLSRDEIEQYVARRFPRHRFPAEFVDVVCRVTEGNPLFMVDLVTDLVRQGALAQQGETWMLSRGLPEWHSDAPRSIRAMIDGAIRRIGVHDQTLLSAATVQGLEFDSSILARSVGADRPEIEDRLKALSTVHGIVRSLRPMPEGQDRTACNFAFVHALHREALHAYLTPTRKAVVSGAVAHALLERDRDHVSDIASTLALLFEAARDPAQGSEYALVAAEHAVRVTGYREAIGLARRGLRLLQSVPEGPERAHRELKLLLTLAVSLGASQGQGTPEIRTIYLRARELSHQIGSPLSPVPILIGLWSAHAIMGKFAEALEFAKELVLVSEEADAPGLVVRAHVLHGGALAHLGNLAAGCQELARARAAYGSSPDPCPFILDAGVQASSELAEYLCVRGFVDEGLECARDAVALAERLGDPYNLTFAFVFKAITHRRRGEIDEAAVSAARALTYSADHELSDGVMYAAALRGWSLCRSGRVTEGVALIQRAQALDGANVAVPFLAVVAESYLHAGRTSDGITAIDRAIAVGDRDSDRFSQSELYRLRGELLLPDRGTAAHREAERLFDRAIEVAKYQGARLFQLLATMRLCRLRREAGSRNTLCQELSVLYESLTEGRNTPTLSEARALLDVVA